MLAVSKFLSDSSVVHIFKTKEGTTEYSQYYQFITYSIPQQYNPEP
jgi:hypothetical protein